MEATVTLKTARLQKPGSRNHVQKRNQTLVIALIATTRLKVQIYHV